MFKHFYSFISLPIISVPSGLFHFFLLSIYLDLDAFMSNQSVMLQLSYRLLCLQHAAPQVPILSHHVHNALSYSIQMHLIHLQWILKMWNSRYSSVSLVTWLRCARGNNLGSIVGMDTAIRPRLSYRQHPVQSVTRSISSMVKLPKI